MSEWDIKSVDVSIGLLPKDCAELALAGKVNGIRTLMQNEIFYVDMNTTTEPRHDSHPRSSWPAPRLRASRPA